MTSIRKPYGYRDNRPDEKNQPTQKKENSKIKQNLIYIGFFALIIWGLYYFMSPYQNCIRDINEVLSSKYKGERLMGQKKGGRVKCIQLTSW